MNKLNFLKKAQYLCLAIISACVITSCESMFEFELPEANSKADTSPPVADFTYNTDPNDWRTIVFQDLSAEATKYSWDFGTGATSSEQFPSYTFAEIGSYTVSLTASDGLNQTNTVTKSVLVEEPAKFLPAIIEAGFEDNTLPDGSGDGRDGWRNSDLGGVIQITTGPVLSGSQAAKLPGDPGDLRIGYQLLDVTAESDYTVKFNYTMKVEPGTITVAILDGRDLEDLSEVSEAVIALIEVTDNTDPELFVEAKIDFNTGGNEKIAILFYNDGLSESRLDNFSIE